eukprot:gene10132-11167_t
MEMNEVNTSLLCFGSRYVDFRLTPSVKVFAVISAYASVTTSIATTIFSSAILYILAKNSELQKPTNILVGGLCLSDLLNSLIAQPLDTVKRIQDFSNIHMCSLKTWSTAVLYFIAGLSGVHIIIISIHRFICISYLTKANAVHQGSFRKITMALPLAWISWALLVGLSSVKIVSSLILNIICTSIVIGSIIIVTCSYLRVRRIYKASSVIDLALSKKTLERRNKRNHYQLKTNLFILMSFIISYLPRVGCFAYEQFDADASFSVTYSCGRVTTTVTQINTMLHPIIYCWRVTSFRKRITLLITRVLAKFH